MTGQNPSEDRNGRDSFHPLPRPGLLVIRKRSRRLPVQPLHAFRLQFHVPENTADSAAGNMTETGPQGTLQTAVREKSAIQRDMGPLLKNLSVFPPVFVLPCFLCFEKCRIRLLFRKGETFPMPESGQKICARGKVPEIRDPHAFAEGESGTVPGIRFVLLPERSNAALAGTPPFAWSMKKQSSGFAILRLSPPQSHSGGKGEEAPGGRTGRIAEFARCRGISENHLMGTGFCPSFLKIRENCGTGLPVRPPSESKSAGS